MAKNTTVKKAEPGGKKAPATRRAKPGVKRTTSAAKRPGGEPLDRVAAPPLTPGPAFLASDHEAAVFLRNALRPDGRNLTHRQQLWVLYAAVGYSGTDAAHGAGYAAKSAKDIAWQNSIKLYLATLRARVSVLIGARDGARLVLLEALAATRSEIVGMTDDGPEYERYPDHRARMTAASKIIDWDDRLAALRAVAEGEGGGVGGGIQVVILSEGLGGMTPERAARECGYSPPLPPGERKESGDAEGKA